ncbi:MAG: hypothetical protein HY897_12415 [Deltaproteobacteria bacterium]|nr:hypothetical protein [Deltaproteobacteria bacterium]
MSRCTIAFLALPALVVVFFGSVTGCDPRDVVVRNDEKAADAGEPGAGFDDEKHVGRDAGGSNLGDPLIDASSLVDDRADLGATDGGRDAGTGADMGDVHTFSRTYGGPADDCCPVLAVTNDGNFLVAGFTTSFGTTDQSLWIFETDRLGLLKWQKNLRGPAVVEITSAWQTGKGTFIVSGRHRNLERTDLAYEGFLLEIATDGEVVGYRAVPEIDAYYEYFGTADDSILIVGWEKTLFDNATDCFIAKSDLAGHFKWGMSVGDAATTEQCYGFDEAPGGVYAVTGSRQLPETSRFFVLVVDAGGGTLWMRDFPSFDGRKINSIEHTSDQGYVLLGDDRLVKVGSSGDVEWEAGIGGSSIREVQGGYLVAGNRVSAGNVDATLEMLDNRGNPMWRRIYGGALLDYASIKTVEDGYLLAGHTASFGAGGQCFSGTCLDIWLMKVNLDGSISEGCSVVRPAEAVTAGVVSAAQTSTTELFGCTPPSRRTQARPRVPKAAPLTSQDTEVYVETQCESECASCGEPICTPPCDDTCQVCKPDGTCGLKEGYECCRDEDCLTPPEIICDQTTHWCVKQSDECPPCEVDQDCLRCLETDVCVDRACFVALCKNDSDCDGLCGASGGTCTKYFDCSCP